MDEYLKSCQTEFWKAVFKKELEYLLKELKDYRDILSIGCGPAIIERGLAERHFSITGLDVSEQALEEAPDSIRKVTGSAENMDYFEDHSFDAVIFVASLQFINDFARAIKEAEALKNLILQNFH